MRRREKRKQEGGGPISPNASLADRFLLLRKITPLVVLSPRWINYLHGRAFTWLEKEGKGKRGRRNGTDREKVKRGT